MRRDDFKKLHQGVSPKLQKRLNKSWESWQNQSRTSNRVEHSTGRIPRNRRVTGFDVEGIDVGRSSQVGVLGGGFPSRYHAFGFNDL